MARNSAGTWPALELNGRELPQRLVYERGVWGKVHGAASDFHWIAATPGFVAPDRQLERELPLGAEDVSDHAATLWRTTGDTSYAVAFYRSRARDATGRSGFLEKQVLEWQRPPDVPAAAGALLLLPRVAKLDPFSQPGLDSQIQWSEEDREERALDAETPLTLSEAAIREAVAEGIRALRASTTEQALAELYAAILAGGRAVALAGLAAPLPAAAMAALLLPLPRAVADHLSLAGWLPSLSLPAAAANELQRCWDVVLAGATAPPRTALPPPTAQQIEEARAMASAIFAADVGEATSRSEARNVELTLWGPSAAGKTVLLSQLYLEADRDQGPQGPDKSQWQVYLTDTSHQFVESHRIQLEKNFFPKATPLGTPTQIEYVFKHPSGATSSLHLEDRAGIESEDLDREGKSLKERLRTANGLVLMFDPMSDASTLEPRVWRMLELIYLASGRVAEKDERPIAVCISKADIFIETATDFSRALNAPREFVRERVPPFLIRALERYCANYELFPISAAGVRLRYGVIEPAVFFDEALQPRLCPGGRPFNLMAPFSWLLKELTNES